MADTLHVYLPHWHAPGWCRSSADSILASRGVDVHLTVINNGGELNLPGEVDVVTMAENVGFSGAANVGLRQWLSSIGEWCVVGAHDLQVHPDTLAALVALASRQEDVGILGPMLTYPSGGRIGGEKTGRRDGVLDATWISGGCMLLRRACIEEIGVFDERLSSYCEDIDLSYRARAAGWRVGIATDITAEGLGAAHPGRAAVLIEANWVLVRKKHAGWAAGVRRLGRLAAGAILILRPSLRAEGLYRLRAFPRGFRLLFSRDRASNQR